MQHELKTATIKTHLSSGFGCDKPDIPKGTTVKIVETYTNHLVRWVDDEGFEHQADVPTRLLEMDS